MKANHPEAIPVRVGDKTYNLRLGPAAFRLAELKHGLTFTVEELGSPTMATLARMAYVGCLVDDPKLKEADFLVAMADSDEGAILSAVGKALERMTKGLSAIGGSDEGNGEPGE